MSKELVKLAATPDPDAPPITNRKGDPEPDPDLRDQENIPLPAGWLSLDEQARQQALVEQAEQYLLDEIRPYLPDAWIDHTKTKHRVRDPLHPPLLRIRAAQACRRNRRRTESRRSRDPATARRAGWMSVAELATPHGWVWHPLGRVMTRSRRDGQPGLDPLSVFLGIGVVPRSEGDDNHNQLGADLGKYLVVEPGDLVFNKLRTWQGGFGASRHTGIVSPAYYVLRPSSGVDSRFIDYLLHSSVYLSELTRLSKWMPPSQFDMPWEDLKALSVPLPPLDVQRRIADFLDDQVLRIDQAVKLRQEQSRLLCQLLDNFVEASFSEANHRGAVRASRLLGVTPGFAFPSEAFRSDGVRLLRGVNVGVGSLIWDDVAYWDPGAANSARLCPFRLEEGDVVVGMDRPWISTGMRIAQVAADDLPALLLQRVAVLRPKISLDRRFMYWAYRDAAFRGAVEVDLTGVSVPHLSGDQILSHRLPSLPIAEQREIAASLDDTDSQTARLQSAISAQVSLLVERKRSLITAAVTGEFDVTSASSRAAKVAVSGVGGAA